MPANVGVTPRRVVPTPARARHPALPRGVFVFGGRWCSSLGSRVAIPFHERSILNNMVGENLIDDVFLGEELMRRRISIFTTAAAATLLVATGLVASQPASVHAQEDAPGIAGGYTQDVCEDYECYTFTALETGESIRVPMASTPSTDTPEETRVQPLGLNPVTIAQCNMGQSDVTVADMPSTKDGLVALKCGNDKVGYVHIRKEHEKDWQSILNQYPIGGTWDDYMLFATKNSLQAPDPSLGMPQVIPGDKRCYSTPVQIKNPDGVVMETIHPSIIVSMNNRVVITSFPTSSSPHCK